MPIRTRKPRQLRPPGTGCGKIPYAVKARAALHLPQAIQEGMTAEQFASLAGIGIDHARTELREVNQSLRDRIGSQNQTTLSQMQDAAHDARRAALANFSRVNSIIGKRLVSLEKQASPSVKELVALTRAMTVAWNGLKDATGLRFAEARAGARLKTDDKTPPALVPDVHVEFLDEGDQASADP